MANACKQFFRCACYYGFLLMFFVGIWTVNLLCLLVSIPMTTALSRTLMRGTVFQLSRIYIGLLIKSGCLKTNYQTLAHLHTGERGSVIIVNHPSILDAPLFLSQIPGLVCVFKSALKDNLLLPRTVKTLGYLSNDEGMEMLRKMTDMLAAGEVVLVFPEGTRTVGETASPFNGGYALAAIRARVPVHLVALRSDTPILSKKQHFLRPTRFPATFSFEIGPTLEPSDFLTVKQLNGFAEQWYQTRLRQPQVEPRAFLPVNVIRECHDDSLHARFTVPQAPFYCAGHMPGAPITPGYAQMAWARELLQTHFSRPLGAIEFHRWRFLQPVLPGDAVEIDMTPRETGWRVTVTRNHTKLTQGRIHLPLPKTKNEGSPHDAI